MSLRPVEFQVLLALADDERHGYAIMREVQELTSGRMACFRGSRSAQ